MCSKYGKSTKGTNLYNKVCWEIPYQKGKAVLFVEWDRFSKLRATDKNDIHKAELSFSSILMLFTRKFWSK